MLDLLFGRHDGLDSLRLLVALYSVAAAFFYLRFVDGVATGTRAAIKTSVFAALAVLPLSLVADGWGMVLLAAALLLSALGDLLLALPDQKRFFVPGLIGFLSAHLAYAGIFVRLELFPGILVWAGLALVWGLAGWFVLWLWPRLGTMKIPVVAYFSVIMVMVSLACLASGPVWQLGAGAIVFAFSDSLIAVRKFARPFACINHGVWITYCLAQHMIAGSIVFMNTHVFVS